MEGVHGVDVSWLHHTSKDQQRSNPSANGNLERSPRSKDSPASSTAKPSIRRVPSDNSKTSGPAQVTPASLPPPSRDTTYAVSSSPSVPSLSPSTARRPQSTSGRPQTLSRNASDKSIEDQKGGSRRPGWMNNLSSKFSSSSQSVPTRASQSYGNQPLKSPTAPVATTAQGVEEIERVDPYTPPRPKESSSSFFSSLTRRLSSATQAAGSPKANANGSICPRKVLNVDPNRERCLVSELDNNKLRRVSFCVDIEIASGPKYRGGDDDELDRKQKRNNAKLKERAEGEALKNPGAIDEEKAGETRSRSASNVSNDEHPRHVPANEESTPAEGMPRDSMDGESLNRKKEKKRRSEAERKERKEQRLRRAQESGQIPIEIGGDDEDEEDETSGAATGLTGVDAALARLDSTPKPPKVDRPTTDPARIYRRCCQLRETPILKRITEQLMSPRTSIPGEPGVVSVLDLTGSRMQLPDVITLGDWLAIVPVKRLLLEDADLNDEGVRVVLSGLLAAKRPEPSKRKSIQPRHREGLHRPRYQERSGIVEKVTFKNNPRLTKLAWRHIALFLYMCRSIKAIDMSMNKFPASPKTTSTSAGKIEQDAPITAAKDDDTAQILFKCLSERLGGNKLEELSVSECSLRATHIRKIIDGAMACGVSRLGLAGNNLNDAGLDYVMHYLKSGVCHGLDLGGNNLRDKLDRIADSLIAKPDTPCWGLSLADCNLDAASVKPLLPALVSLPNFRFIDLSRNHDLCPTAEDARYNIVSLLRRYLGQMKELKRIHLNDVNMTPKQAIGLAEVLSEAPRLAHVSVLKNAQLTALANGTDEASQEEAAAMYASFMMAVRCSKTLICIDIDVPGPEASEVVKALAKQVVAYSLRNMDQFAIAEATGDSSGTSEKGVRSVQYPDVLLHLVGHVDDVPENHDKDGPAPDDDYIVGGTGVVKALQYVLGEKANDIRRTSAPGSPAGGIPRDRPGSSAGLSEIGKVRAKEVSRQLLDSARKIRLRLQPAILKEAKTGDEMAWRRLQFLDSTLESMISRFEEEYPETRMHDGATFQPNVFLDSKPRAPSNARMEDEVPPELDLTADDEDEERAIHTNISRHNSDASLASRSMTLEEGRLHRKGQSLRREVINSSPARQANDKDTQAAQAKLRQEKERIRMLADRIESTPGEVLRPLVDQEGWAAVLRRLGANYDDLRAMQQQDPEGWEQLIDAQMKAKINVDRDREANPDRPGTNMF